MILVILLAVVLGGALLSGGGSAGAGTGSGSSGSGFATVNAASLISALRTMTGWLYSLGAGLEGEKPSPPYTDCGEFIRRGLSLVGVSGVPRNITGQVSAAPYTRSVQGYTRTALLEALKPGDCIAFKWASGGFEGRPYDHGGVYVGNGKMIHASSSAGKVVEASVPGSGWKTIYSWTR